LKPFAAALGLLGLLCACATSRPDHFYILNAQPEGRTVARAAPAAQATLKVTLPSVVDRPEIVLNTSAEGVTVLEHERWAAPLADLVAQTLGQDIERRRPDLVVGGPSASHSAGSAIRVAVDIVQVTLRRGDRAAIEVHWRILDTPTSTDIAGGDVFSAPLAAEGYAAIAESLSECLGMLAQALAGQMPRAP
jgi:uncharacterized lipoprotein YmbA